MHNRRQPRKNRDREFRSNEQGKTQPDSSSIRNQLFSKDAKYNKRSREWVISPKSEQFLAWKSLVAATTAHIESKLKLMFYVVTITYYKTSLSCNIRQTIVDRT